MENIDSNTPVSSDGRVTEASAQKRIEEKIFGKPKEAPAPQVDAAPQEPQAEAPETPVENPETPVDAAPKIEEDEFFEHELEPGVKWKLPKAIKPAIDGYQDYTKKTMEAADRQRQADLILEQARQSQQMQAALQPKYEAVTEVDRQIKQYENVDWNTWISTNPVEAQKGMLQLQVLRDQRNRAAQELNQAAQMEMHKINETRAKLRDENMKVLQRDLKNWSADEHKTLLDFAGKTYGFSDTELSQVFDYKVVKMMADAREWRKLQASKPQVEKKAALASKTLKPQAADQRNAKQVQQASIKKDIRTAKTDQDKQKAIQRFLESRL
jgi:hypothetical protein